MSSLVPSSAEKAISPATDDPTEILIYLPGIVERCVIKQSQIDTAHKSLCEAVVKSGGITVFGVSPEFLCVIGAHVSGWRFRPLPPTTPDKQAVLYNAQIETLKAQKKFFDREWRENGRGEEWRDDQ